MASRWITGLIAACLSLSVGAAELVVFCPGAVQSIVTGLAKEFSQSAGHSVKFIYGTAGSVAKKVADGETGDVVISTNELLANLSKAGKVAAPSVRALGSMGVGVTTRKGNPLPDVSTVPSFKSAMLAATSITFADPAFGGQSGIHVAKVFEQLGIAQELKPRLQLRPGAPEAFKEVARGEIEIGLGQISEILANKDVVLVGPLPAEIQNSVAFSAGLHTAAGPTDAAQAFIAYLVTPAAKERFKALGFDVK